MSGCPPESILYAIINRLQEGDDIPILRCIAEFVDGGDRNDWGDVLQGPDTSPEIKGGVVNQQ